MQPAQPTNPPQPMRVCILLEATPLMSRYWADFRGNYVEPLLTIADPKMQHRYPAGSQVACEFCLILFRSTEMNSEAAVESSMWTQELADLRAMLDVVQFVGGGGSEVAVAEALDRAIYMQSLPSMTVLADSLSQPSEPPPCHCILVTAGEPSRMPVIQPYNKGPSTTMHKLGPRAQTWQDIMPSLAGLHKIHLSILTPKDHGSSRQQYVVLWLSKVADNTRGLETAALYQECGLHQQPHHLFLLNPAWSLALGVFQRKAKEYRTKQASQPGTAQTRQPPLAGATKAAPGMQAQAQAQPQAPGISPGMPAMAPQPPSGASAFSTTAAQVAVGQIDKPVLIGSAAPLSRSGSSSGPMPGISPKPGVPGATAPFPRPSPPQSGAPVVSPQNHPGQALSPFPQPGYPQQHVQQQVPAAAAAVANKQHAATFPNMPNVSAPLPALAPNNQRFPAAASATAPATRQGSYPTALPPSAAAALPGQPQQPPIMQSYPPGQHPNAIMTAGASPRGGMGGTPPVPPFPNYPYPANQQPPAIGQQAVAASQEVPYQDAWRGKLFFSQMALQQYVNPGFPASYPIVEIIIGFKPGGIPSNLTLPADLMAVRVTSKEALMNRVPMMVSNGGCKVRYRLASKELLTPSPTGFQIYNALCKVQRDQKLFWGFDVNSNLTLYLQLPDLNAPITETVAVIMPPV